MAVPDSRKIYPRKGDDTIVYLKNVVRNPDIEVGDFTFYHDFVHDPKDFEKNCVLYHYPVNGDKLKIGKFCSIACGTKFLFNGANHTLRSLSRLLRGMGARALGRQGMGQQGRHRGRQRRVDRL